jgi:hypothetical protein
MATTSSSLTTTPVPGLFASDLPKNIRSDGPSGNYVDQAYSVYQYVRNFILHNLEWLNETSGKKTLLIKIPEAIVSISNRIGAATHIPGRMINFTAEILSPLHRLGGCGSALLGFAEAGKKYSPMFKPIATHVKYVVRDLDGNPYEAHFSVPEWQQMANKTQSIIDWVLSVTGCASYIWKLQCTDPKEQFPLAPLLTWGGRFMAIHGLYSEGRFLYETVWMRTNSLIIPSFDDISDFSAPIVTVQQSAPKQMGEGFLKRHLGPHQRYDIRQKKYVPIQHQKGDTKELVLSTRLANEEVVGSLLRLSFCVACISLDLFKTCAANGNNSGWLDSAIFCTNIASTFIAPVALRYWPHMVILPLQKAAEAV